MGAESILISVNPYRLIEGLYNTDLMKQHYQLCMSAQKKLPPHVYAIAAQARARDSIGIQGAER